MGDPIFWAVLALASLQATPRRVHSKKIPRLQLEGHQAEGEEPGTGPGVRRESCNLLLAFLNKTGGVGSLNKSLPDPGDPPSFLV